MRIHLLSDLHLEFGGIDLPEVDADVVVLAGDIHTGDTGLQWAGYLWPDTPVVYVLGNHEYYGHVAPALAEKLRGKALGSQVHVLNNEALTLDGVTFLGTTLWTDLDLHGAPGMAEVAMQRGMSDCRHITFEHSNRRLRAKDTLRLHWTSRRWLAEELHTRRGEKIVVVTHHAPCAQSLGDAERAHPLAACYASRMEEVVASSGAAIWLHGHTHRSRDYRVGDVRVVCNARGYPDEPAEGFDAGLVIEV